MIKRTHARILDLLIFDQPWAIRPPELETIIDRVQNHGNVDLDAVAAKLGRPLDNTNGNGVDVRGGLAILAIEGPLVRYASIFTNVSGMTSVEFLMQDLQTALDAPHIQQIVLNVNSPGGQVDGINELADAIRLANEQKPVIAYVDGMAASAAYWLASAADRIVVNESASLGSIGVVAALTDTRDAEQRRGVRRYEIVSSQSPKKRPDPATEEGHAQILRRVDNLAQLFIDRVASFRGVTADKVMQDFGRGDILPASEAIAAGMADSLGSFEPLISELNGSSRSIVPAPRVSATRKEVTTMNAPEPSTAAAPAPPAAAAPATTPPAAIAAPAAPAAVAAPAAPTTNDRTAERQRIAAILALPEAKGREALAQELATGTDLEPEQARKILAAAPAAAPAAPANPLAAQMAQLPNPKIGTGTGGPDNDSPQAEAERVLAFVPKDRKVARAS